MDLLIVLLLQIPSVRTGMFCDEGATELITHK